MNDLSDRFREQAGHCEALGSPFMGRLCRLLGDRLTPGAPLTDRLFGWEGDIGPGGHSLPLRLCGGLHALNLLGRGGLAPVYPPREAADDTLWAAIAGALETEANFLNQWIDSPPQTNEVRRSAILIAAGRALGARFDRPLVLSELGASGGLNLMWDHYALNAQGKRFGPQDAPVTLTPDWRGVLPANFDPRVIERRGVDLNPLDPHKADDQLRLLAYLWPDQADRIDRTRAAISIYEATVDKADGIDWLQTRLTPRPGACHMIYSTIAWQYFPAEARARGAAMIEAAGRAATAQAPLAWFTMENDGAGNGAKLTMRLWPGELTIDCGRADFHGRWVDWRDPA